ncbi:LysR family transcriptional regulator [Leeia aquatica]|uniref:LysR family transcriptional regulator n=1 Tax=Leeia aquatica TaxID=2725557 RepID=A0A847S7B3_9NEIS|nr:LysR family transcriptional regulator [Leeia aquatica]NLR75643.1 LysR family transcriptional regulator [Leeia aquatica]
MARHFDEVMLGSIELFCTVAECGSFTAAAVKSGLGQPAVSRSISRLEQRLGVKLFERTTRRINLTDAGQHYYQQCRDALSQINAAERALADAQRTPSGIVRLSLPTPLGHYRILPLLPAFHARYPQVELEIQLSNHNVDFVVDGFDLAVRGRPPKDSGLVSRPLLDAELVVVASPDYVLRHGAPNTPDALLQHQCIQFHLPSSGQLISWLFQQEGRAFSLPTQGALRCSDDLLGCVTLARAGGGILQTYRFIVEHDLQNGRLLELLPDYGGRSRPFSLLYPRQPHMPQRLRVLIDWLLAAFAPPQASPLSPPAAGQSA